MLFLGRTRDLWYLSSQANFSLCRRRRPIAFIKTERQREKNGEKPLQFDNFTILSLSFFSIKLLFLGLSRNPWYQRHSNSYVTPNFNILIPNLIPVGGIFSALSYLFFNVIEMVSLCYNNVDNSHSINPNAVIQQ